ncbi:unnamed protein product [Meloidogyne enterolobii]|uniref:Uncharacterized protein n=1 Tax=Meloidogyne enterolobii TaxID=390850 RepID=A0ACB1AWC0_MELEN
MFKNYFILIFPSSYLLNIIIAINPPPYGKLTVNKKGQLIGSNGKIVQLRGPSLFIDIYSPDFYSDFAVRAIKCFFNGNIVRAPFAPDGFEKNPNVTLNLAYKLIDGAINNGIYVIVDWHGGCNCWDNNDIKKFTNNAIKFYKTIMKKYKGIPNILLELWNEPSCHWNIVKKYHMDVLNEVRKIDSEVIAILGSSDVTKDPDDGVPGKNIMYTLHWYPIWEPLPFDYTEEILKNASKKNQALFVTEYGDANVAPLDAKIEPNKIKRFYELMDKYKLSYNKWTLVNLIDPKYPEKGMALMFKTCNIYQIYQESCLSDSGKLYRQQMWKYDNGIKGC